MCSEIVFNFEDISTDAPHTRHLANAVYEKASIISKDVESLNQAVTEIIQTQLKLTDDYRALFQLIQSISNRTDIFDDMGKDQREEHKLMCLQFGSFISEFAEIQKTLSSNMQSTVLHNIANYVDLFSSLNMDAKHLDMCEKSKEQAFHSYMKLPKKSSVKDLQSSALELSTVRRECYRKALRYYGHLNMVDGAQEIVPLIIMTSTMDCLTESVRKTSSMFGDAASGFLEVGRTRIDKISSLNSNINRQFNAREDNCLYEPLSHFSPEPWILSPDATGNVHPDPTVQPNQQLASKSGRLLLRTRTNLVWRWVDIFCSTQSGNLMFQHYEDIAARLLLDLNQKGVYLQEAECDDRRNVFQIISPTEKKTLFLQAESQLERSEWMHTLTNIIFHRDNLQIQHSKMASPKPVHKLDQPEQTPLPVVVTRPSGLLDDILSCAPLPNFDLPKVHNLNSLRDAELLVDIHRMTADADMDSAVASCSQSGNDVLIESDLVADPIDSLFIGSVVPSADFDANNQEQLNDLFSFILSCRSASATPNASPCLLMVTRHDLWVLDADTPVTNDERGKNSKHNDVLARIPFSKFRSWSIYPDNPKLACLLVSAPLEDTPLFAHCQGSLCFAFESEYNQWLSERLLAAHLDRISILEGAEGEIEKTILLNNVTRLSENCGSDSCIPIQK